jgi:trimethylamine-N-oxide reductase cytochrome c-type subunit TorC
MSLHHAAASLQLPVTRPARWRRAFRWLLAPGVLAGIALGVIGWGGFNTAMEATNSLGFCISCHEMRDNVYSEYQSSTHYRNASGVRAVCADCHVPRDWTHKVIRKFEASRELYFKLVGSIDAAEKFERRRLDLARREWARMRESDSRECRNCHAFEAMDFHRQRAKAAAAMQAAAQNGGWTCIDCHKGIAHRMPDVTARYKAMRSGLDAPLRDFSVDSVVRSYEHIPFYADISAASGGKPAGEIAPLASLIVVERRDDRIKVDVRGWQRNGYEEQIVLARGERVLLANLGAEAAVLLKTNGPLDDDNEWRTVSLRAWIDMKRVTPDAAALDRYGAEMYEASCALCHKAVRPEAFTVNQWIGKMNAMKRFVPLDENEYALLLSYVQRLAAKSPGG